MTSSMQVRFIPCAVTQSTFREFAAPLNLALLLFFSLIPRVQLCQGPRQTKKAGVFTNDLFLLGSPEFRFLFTQCCEIARSHFSVQLQFTELLNL